MEMVELSVTPSASTIGTSSLFKMMDLPTELRLQILKQLLIYDEEIYLPKTSTPADVKEPIPEYSVDILQTCKKINAEGTPILYGLNKFSVLLSTDFKFQLGFNHFRWTTIPLFTCIKFISTASTLTSLAQDVKASFTCTGSDIMSRFYSYDQQYSPNGPDKFMALSVQNWISTKVMTAELRAVQRRLEALMDAEFEGGGLVVGGDNAQNGYSPDAGGATAT